MRIALKSTINQVDMESRNLESDLINSLDNDFLLRRWNDILPNFTYPNKVYEGMSSAAFSIIFR